MLPKLRSLCLLSACVFALACRHPAAEETVPVTTEFGNPERVAIVGYEGDAMEPFLTRDGKYLFFNNLNEPQVNTNLYWAQRIDDLHFQYRGELNGVNTAALEGVPSMDRDGNFYFVSNRSYDKTASTLYRGKFAMGSLTGVELVPGVSLAKPGIVNFDAEISADGNTLYYVESEFSLLGSLRSARILIARRHAGTFLRDPASEALMAAVNSEGLNYAPATPPSDLEMFFTRATSSGPIIFVASRANVGEPFGKPLRIASITGFAEAPTLSPDGESIYFHKKVDGHFAIFRVTRP